MLAYPHIRKRHGWRTEEIEQFVDGLRLAATRIPGVLQIRAVPDDPADDKILACAVEGQVDYVIASDKHLTSLGNYQGIPIVLPRPFLQILERDIG